MDEFTEADVSDQSGKCFIVTGANTGLGFEVSRVLAARGARVLLACRDKARAEDTMARIKQSTATSFGDVMLGPMLKRSGGGPYRKMAQALTSATQGGASSGSDPQVVRRSRLRQVDSCYREVKEGGNRETGHPFQCAAWLENTDHGSGGESRPCPAAGGVAR